jgi:hypothetical protein
LKSKNEARSVFLRIYNVRLYSRTKDGKNTRQLLFQVYWNTGKQAIAPFNRLIIQGGNCSPIVFVYCVYGDFLGLFVQFIRFGEMLIGKFL